MRERIDPTSVRSVPLGRLEIGRLGVRVAFVLSAETTDDKKNKRREKRIPHHLGIAFFIEMIAIRDAN
jgi:hypothetical protein